MSDLEKQIKVMQDAVAKGKPRTLENFVDDMICQSRTLSHTLTVAGSTRWKGQKQRIKELYHERTS